LVLIEQNQQIREKMEAKNLIAKLPIVLTKNKMLGGLKTIE